MREERRRRRARCVQSIRSLGPASLIVLPCLSRLTGSQRDLTSSVPAMSTCNFTHATFVLIGIPGLEQLQFWIGFPLLSMYAVALFGNCIVVFIVRMEAQPPRSMYLFLCTGSHRLTWPCPHPPCPRSSRSSGYDSREITFDACMTQMFFIHALSAIESTILLAMSFDRYM